MIILFLPPEPAQAVVSGQGDRAILICGTGIGMSMAANKVKGIRCALCSEPYSAKLTRMHNDSNALALGARVIGPELARMIVETWLDTEFEGGRAPAPHRFADSPGERPGLGIKGRITTALPGSDLLRPGYFSGND